MEGIAAGADVDVDAVWTANLLDELESLMNRTRVGHCSDIYAVSGNGYGASFAHGHNEDWPGIVKHYWFWTVLIPEAGADFQRCAGMTMPGTLVGWGATWNARGVYLTQNTLFPWKTTPGGLGSAFIQREAMCGEAGSRGLDAVVRALTAAPWSDGASVNLVDLRARRMANVEVHQGEHVTTEVTHAMGNFSHFNMYKTMLPLDQGPNALLRSSTHRQARVNAMPAPRCKKDIMAILSDTEDSEYPIFRDETLATLILDGDAGVLRVWCCGQSA
eukprot:CAMPEP_0195146374 /NCGR_PEP_ID=MMETSP0448-20130528/171547_1 /TAXON_ID=66468 /ORGANISM="Heterocapsa triquestra, Strain CCMP 448" /LENGTH=273 /DNA_ID=CAMNT_0040184923 /DNA_START=3 /DNA_END=820 /DNA_ORIENTATION=-